MLPRREPRSQVGSPFTIAAHDNLGQALRGAKDCISARAVFRDTIVRDPKHVRVCRSLAVRDTDILPKLPADERAEWERFWADVRALKP